MFKKSFNLINFQDTFCKSWKHNFLFMLLKLTSYYSTKIILLRARVFVNYSIYIYWILWMLLKIKIKYLYAVCDKKSMMSRNVIHNSNIIEIVSFENLILKWCCIYKQQSYCPHNTVFINWIIVCYYCTHQANQMYDRRNFHSYITLICIFGVIPMIDKWIKNLNNMCQISFH